MNLFCMPRSTVSIHKQTFSCGGCRKKYQIHRKLYDFLVSESLSYMWPVNSGYFRVPCICSHWKLKHSVLRLGRRWISVSHGSENKGTESQIKAALITGWQIYIKLPNPGTDFTEPFPPQLFHPAAFTDLCITQGSEMAHKAPLSPYNTLSFSVSLSGSLWGSFCLYLALCL